MFKYIKSFFMILFLSFVPVCYGMFPGVCPMTQQYVDSAEEDCMSCLKAVVDCVKNFVVA